MLNRIALEIVAAVVTIVVATFAVFVLTIHLPGDPALAMFRARYGDAAVADEERLDAIRHEAGFDDPVLVQYGRWLGDMAQGDFGTSSTSGRDVGDEIARRIPLTATITFGSLLAAFILALPLALLTTRSRLLNNAVLAVTQVGASVPDFLLILVLVLLFGVTWSVLPVAGWGEPQHVVLPCLVLGAFPCALFTRLMAVGLDEHLQADFVRTGRAKGLGERYLLLRHVLPHAVFPVISIAGIQCAYALSTALVVEVMFAIPGTGRLLFDAINSRDLPTVQAALAVQITLAIVASKMADLAMIVADPTVRRPMGSGR